MTYTEQSERHLADEIKKRSAVYARYRELLGGKEGLTLCPAQEGVTPNYAYFPAVFDKAVFGADRDEVYKELEENNIFARKYFYPITTAFDCYKGRFDPEATPVALDISKRVLTLPIYADLALEDVDRICGIILSLSKT